MFGGFVGRATTTVIARRSSSPGVAFRQVGPGVHVHGITDGTWSVADAVLALLRMTGPAHCVISTWTAGNADIKRADRMLKARELLSLRMLVDRSFLNRQPEYCAQARERFGDDAIRVWAAHAKFVILHGGEWDVLYLTSANFNANPRLENFSVYADQALVEEYLALVQTLYDGQAPGEGFRVKDAGRTGTKQALRGFRLRGG